MKHIYILQKFYSLVFFIFVGFLLFFSSCGMSKEEQLNDAFLKDSLQYEETKLLKQSNREVLDSLEIDTALNNPNSKDPAIPVFDDEN